MHYTYILLLADKSYYHGFSSNLRERVKDHQEGSVPSTKNLRPVTLVFYAAFQNEKLARKFENYLKTGSGFAFRNKHFVEHY